MIIHTIDEYIAEFTDEAHTKLLEMRAIIRANAPGATEAISYAMPTFKLYGKNLVHFAAYKNHIGFYPIPNAIKAFNKELSIYKQGKGSVQFPMDKPLPKELIAQIVKYRVKTVNETLKK